MSVTIDPPVGFRGELNAAVALLNPQIEGLADLRVASISPDAKALVGQALTDRSRRRTLIQDVLAAMDAVVASWGLLTSDGYPAIPATVADSALFTELKAEADAIATAVGVFTAQPVAAKLMINLGTPTNKVP